ncbi:MAG: dihydroorotase [Eubacteriales bacterium]
MNSNNSKASDTAEMDTFIPSLFGGDTVIPSLCDLHVHLREPGQEYKETIATGLSAASAGGFSHVACMPNTSPTLDCPELIRFVYDRAEEARKACKDTTCEVHVVGAITKGLKGAQLCDFPALLDAGAVAFSDDGRPVSDEGMMEHALLSAKACGALIISHSEDLSYPPGAINAGEYSKKLGLIGSPVSAEADAIARDVLLAGRTGARLHVAHVSTARSVEVIRRAKASGIDVTCETCPHYFTLTDSDVERFGVNAKMNPPLRTRADVEAIIEGLRDGTIDCISTDHAPHSPEDKREAQGDIEQAANGIVGLETSFALSYTVLVRSGHISLERLVELMSTNPKRILGIKDSPESFIKVDLENNFTVDKQSFRSKGRNTPFHGMELWGRIVRS